MILAIDPGTKRHAAAVFLTTTGRLDAVSFVSRDPYRLAGEVPLVSEVVIETPQIHGATRGKDPNDIVELGVAVGELSGFFAGRNILVARVTPSAWKGTVKKWIHHSRIWSILSPAERVVAATGIGMSPEAIEEKIRDACKRWAVGDVTKAGQVRGYSWQAHNLLDAIGLGLWRTNRVARGGARR